MPRLKKEQTNDAPLPKAVRRDDASPVADTAKMQNARKARSASSGSESRTPPPNARVIKNSYKTGTVSRRAVRAAIKRLRAES